MISRNRGAAQLVNFEVSEGFDLRSGAEPQGQISDSSVSLTGGATGTGARWAGGGTTGKKGV
jgi:hypothetical protein